MQVKTSLISVLKNSSRLIFLVVCLISFFSWELFADNTGLEGFNALNYRPNIDGLGFLNIDTADVLIPGVFYSGATFQYARRTLSFTDPALNNLTTDLAENQVIGDIVFGVGVLDFLDLGVDVPILFMQNGTKCLNATCSNLTNYTGHALGDLRFVLKLKVLDEANDFISLALMEDLGVPTGDSKLFTGGNNVSYEQKLILSKKTGHVDLAVNAGYMIVAKTQTIGTTYDDHMTFGVGAKGKLPHKMFAQGTISGNIFFEDQHNEALPVEFMASFGRDFKNNISCSIGGGTRINDGIGAADYRLMGSCGVNIPLTQKSKKLMEAREKGVSYKELVAGKEWVISMATDQYSIDLISGGILEDVIRFLNGDQMRQVIIIGNADDRLSYDHNMDLSTKRAISARDYLIHHGVNPKQIVMSTYGEAIPIEDGKSEAAREVNRGIVIKEVLGGK